MIKNNYIFAGKVIEISSIYASVHDLCAGYRTDSAPDICVSTSAEDIEYERMRSAREDEAEGRQIQQYSDSYLEELAVYRKIADKLPAFDTILFHGSVVAVDGQGYLFTAKSGTGKSTHTRLWREYFGERAVMVNDDKPLIHIGETVTVYGTPYNGKHHLGSNISVPLRAICILTRSEENHISPVSAQEAYPMLMQQVYRSSDVSVLSRTLSLVDGLAEKTALYRLGCNMEKEAAVIAYNGMNGTL